MKNFQILFLDIDGTILKADHTIEDSTKDAIKQVKAQGIEVFLATGRPLHEVYDIAKELDVHSFIGYNGAFAIYQDKTVVNEPMKPSTIKHYLQVAKLNKHEMVLYTNNKNTFTSLEAPIVKEFIDYFDLKENELFTEKVIDEILGITVINLNANDPELYKTEDDIFFSQVNVKGLEHSYDVIRDTVNKGQAIKTILELLNIPKENAIAFGDGMNDKQMLQAVSEGFAMGNAHPDLFQYAKHKTTSVSDSGIYNGLKSLNLVK